MKRNWLGIVAIVLAVLVLAFLIYDRFSKNNIRSKIKEIEAINLRLTHQMDSIQKTVVTQDKIILQQIDSALSFINVLNNMKTNNDKTKNNLKQRIDKMDKDIEDILSRHSQ